MKILYYDCFAGISGDMNLGAMIDLGVGEDFVIRELGKLGLDDFSVRFEKKQKMGITGTRAVVEVSGHQHQHHNHHRTFADIKTIIGKSFLSDTVKALAINIFSRIANAEAKIHNIPVEEIHFHEIGAIDSIVDIVGAAICIDSLKPDKIMSSTIELGGGFVTCAHGVFPVPAPATAEILRDIPVKSGVAQAETTTPTGAAILAECVNEFTDIMRFSIDKIGYGLGERDLPVPNVLRAYLGSTGESGDTEHEDAIIAECNLDDMNPEMYDYIFDVLFKSGANDVFITPIIMKKSRPAVTLSALCNEKTLPGIEKILFTETSTLGIRKYKVDKEMLVRKSRKIKTPYGDVNLKMAFLSGKLVKSKPEYDDCLKIAREQNISLSALYTMINKLIIKDLDEK